MSGMMSAAQFDYVREVVRKKSAIVLDNGKEYLAELRLSALAQMEGCASVGDLIDRMRQQPNGALETQAIEAMTTNETSFFRDVHPFETLKQHIMPDLAKRRPDKRVNIWSAASSTGQEAYSIVMSLLESVYMDWQYSVLGTDLSSAVVRRAQEGIYTQLEVNRGLPARSLIKYFVKNALAYQIKPEVRKRVDFRQMNLIGAWPVIPAMDIVFIRNVLIYFDTETRRQILDRVAKVMRSDGYLILGGSETALNLGDRFEMVRFGQSTVYRLKGGAR